MKPEIITLTLNPCIDKTIQVQGFKPGQTNRVLSSREDVGGKGLNVSRVLCGSGANVLTAGLAAENCIKKINTEFAARDVPTLFVQSNGKTRVNLKIIDDCTGRMTELNEPGFPVGNAAQTLSRELEPLLRTAKLLTLSGSLPPDVPADAYRIYIEQSKSFGLKVILDADHDAMRQGVEAAPYAVKPNLAELEHLAGHPLNDTAQIFGQIQRLHAHGISLVCVSMGANGALFSQGGTILHTKPFPIRVGSPAAAGDSMTAMLAYGVLHAMPLPEIARLACAAGTCTAAKNGTQTASFAEILAHANEVIITTVQSTGGING